MGNVIGLVVVAHVCGLVSIANAAGAGDKRARRALLALGVVCEAFVVVALVAVFFPFWPK